MYWKIFYVVIFSLAMTDVLAETRVVKTGVARYIKKANVIRYIPYPECDVLRRAVIPKRKRMVKRAGEKRLIPTYMGRPISAWESKALWLRARIYLYSFEGNMDVPFKVFPQNFITRKDIETLNIGACGWLKIEPVAMRQFRKQFRQASLHICNVYFTVNGKTRLYGHVEVLDIKNKDDHRNVVKKGFATLVPVVLCATYDTKHGKKPVFQKLREISLQNFRTMLSLNDELRILKPWEIFKRQIMEEIKNADTQK